MSLQRFEPHAHTHYSNLRLLDAINRPKDLINRAISLGLSGIAITEHETLASHIEVNQYAKEIAEEHPDFKVALGNEIYLCDSRKPGQKYYHFILIAKNAEGHKALRELSTTAWLNAFFDKGMHRVVTLKSDLIDIVKKYPNSLIATSACLGSELGASILNLTLAETVGDTAGQKEWHENIVNYVNFCKSLFKDDFYIECAPSRSKDQLIVNGRLPGIAEAFGVKMVLGCDAHYLKKEDRFVHKAYLNSKGGDREVDAFYSYAYQQTEEEILEHFENTPVDYAAMVKNSQEIYDKIESYSLEHSPVIPLVEVKEYPSDYSPVQSYPLLTSLFTCEDVQTKYWINTCYEALQKMNLSKEDWEIYLNRLQEEADIIVYINNQMNINLFAYFNTMKYYIDVFWEEGSIVGPGRGSSLCFLSNYLLNITQLDPIEWNLPVWRFLNKERAELPDIDIDLAPSKRPQILQRVKRERGGELGCTLIATFGTEKTKSAILSACRGYRSEDYIDGIDIDTAQYMSSLIPSERGFLWPLKDVVEGNKEKGRKPINSFIKEVEKYPRLLETMLAIEGLINKRSSHAAGVVMFDDDPFAQGCFMRTPRGEVITQWDLDDCAAAGMVKYDWLVTEISDKIIQTIKLLEEDEVIERRPLREQYNHYLHPKVIDLDNKEIWTALGEGSVLDCFQFSTDVGLVAAKKLKPTSPQEMADANALMRLVSERGIETPLEKHARFKNDISLWYEEMERYHLTKDQIKLLEPHYLKSYGTPPLQEDLMLVLMNEGIANFTLAEANAARTIVGKKKMDKIPELKQQMYEKMESKHFADYVWDTAIAPTLGYAFSSPHSLAYSFVGIQSLVLATQFDPIYWNTACLQVNSGALDMEEERSTDYGKIAKAIGDITSRGIEVSLVDINKSSYTFIPDLGENKILFGLKALNGVGINIIARIIEGRPYESLTDFMNRTPVNKTVMTALIKAGAFDKLENKSRSQIMAEYIWLVCPKKKRITLQNFNGLMEHNLLPQELEFEKRVFVFNKALKKYCKIGDYYLLTNNFLTFYEEFFDGDNLEILNNQAHIRQERWEKIYKKVMNKARDYFTKNQEELLTTFNKVLFKEMWNQYAAGSIAAWEMSSLGFYYTEHELKDIDTKKYGLTDFTSLPEEPIVDYFFRRNKKDIPIFKTYSLIGTVIAKDDVRSIVTILTTTGVVPVKFSKEYYAKYNRQISVVQIDGKKKVMEKSWFTRGTMIMVTGYRKGDQFHGKSYKNTANHQLYKITEINGATMKLTHLRYGEESND